MLLLAQLIEYQWYKQNCLKLEILAPKIPSCVQLAVLRG